MKKIHALLISFLVSTFALQNISCASYRVVPLAKGTGPEGNVRDFYAIAENNVIIPEYVINERAEYPTTRETAWSQFESRKDVLEEKMRDRYAIPNNIYYAVKSGFFAVAYTVLFPITFPAYYFTVTERGRSVSNYFEVMIHGQAREPKLRDELKNY